MWPRASQPQFSGDLGLHAEESLLFIRRTMERSATFTAVPGLGGACMGVVGVAAALVAADQTSPGRWLAVWLASAAIAIGIGVVAMRRKSDRLDAPLAGAVGRRFVSSLLAPLVAGAALTFALWRRDDCASMPALWLLLYGAGVLGGGAFSVPALRALGAAFMAIGVAAVLTPPSLGDLWLGAGFGGLQLAFGLYIAKRHGG